MRSLFLILTLFTLAVKAAEKPNVLFILSDDQAWNDYGFMGNEVLQTPHLDKLSKESLVFTRGYVTAPLCRPSLASMVSGKYVHQHGVTGNDVTNVRGAMKRYKESRPQIEAFNKQTSLISDLVDNGYLAFQSGKWWEGSWKEAHFTGGMTHGDPKKGGRHGDVGLQIGRKGIEPVTDFISSAMERKKPFFVWYAPFLPHTPHNPPKNLFKKYKDKNLPDDQAKYYAMCDWFDATCGELLNFLKEKKISDNTLVVYICDNGWVANSQSDVEPPEKWNMRYAPRSKGSPFEKGIRTPIMLKLPGKIKAETSHQPVSAIDLYPTIMKICGLKPSIDLPGIVITDKEPRNKRNAVFGASYAIQKITPGNPAKNRQYRWIITPKWKLLVRDKGEDEGYYTKVHNWDDVPVRLYNLTDDPVEKNNLAEKNPEKVKELKAQLEAWLK